MSKHKATITPLGWAIRSLSLVIRALASLQATLIMREGKNNGKR